MNWVTKLKHGAYIPEARVEIQAVQGMIHLLMIGQRVNILRYLSGEDMMKHGKALRILY